MQRKKLLSSIITAATSISTKMMKKKGTKDLQGKKYLQIYPQLIAVGEKHCNEIKLVLL